LEYLHAGPLQSCYATDAVACVRFLAVADSFLQYAETLRERGRPVDVTRSGDDLLVRATTLRTTSLTAAAAAATGGGGLYRTPGVTFTPCYDVQQLLADDDDDDNVVGRVTAVSRSPGTVATRAAAIATRPQ